MMNVDTASGSMTNVSSSPSSNKQPLFCLVRLFKGKKRSNRTAATTSFCDDESFLRDFEDDDDDDILIDLTKKKGKRRKKKSWSKYSSSSSLSSLSSRRSSGIRSRRESWRNRRMSNSRNEADAVSALLDMGDAELAAKHEERAIACWKQAVKMSREACPDMHECALWKLALLHVRKCLTEPRNRSEALAYLHQMELERITDDWLVEVDSHDEASLLLDLFCEMSQWSVALRLAETMGDEVVSPHTLARIRFQVAQQSGSVELLEACSSEGNEELHREATMALAKAYAKRGEWSRALETNSKLLDTSDPVQKAEAFAQKAELCFVRGHVDLAWDALQEGFDYSNHPEAELRLLQTKAQLLYKTHSFLESLQVHQELLSKWRVTKGPVCPEVAKTYYTMGRICLKANMAYKAVECFCQELHVTQVALGKNHMEVARIMHEIARLYDEHLGDYDHALKFYKKALAVEQGLVRRDEKSLGQRELLLQIRETQRCMGRIHYKKGDFGMAVRTSFDGAPLSN